MRRIRRADVVVCGLAAVLSACDNEAPAGATPTTTSEVPTFAAGGSCNQPGRPGGTIVAKVTTGVAWGVAVRDDGLAYYTDLLGGGIGITSTRTRTVDGFIPTGDFPTDVAFSPDGATAYVANQSGTITLIDVATHAPRTSISTNGMAAYAVQVSPDGSQLFVGGNSTTLLVLDTQTLEIVKTVDVGDSPNAFAVAPDNRMLYVSSFADGTVSEIDMFTGSNLRTFSVGGTPQGLALNRRGTHLYVGNEQGYLSDIDLTTGQIGVTIPLAGGAFGVGVTPDDNQAYIAIPAAGVVQVFSLQSRKIAGSLNVGGNPRRIAFSRAGKIGAVTNAEGFITFIR